MWVLDLWILLVQSQLRDSGYLLLELFLHSFVSFLRGNHNLQSKLLLMLQVCGDVSYFQGKGIYSSKSELPQRLYPLSCISICVIPNCAQTVPVGTLDIFHISP